MPAFKITLAYDGTGLVGWQRQAAGTSVQGLLEHALFDLDRRDVTVTGAGRTDAGVHALGQVASFTIERGIAAEALARALNARLPDSVRVTLAEEVPAAFHARFDARAKTYRYRIFNGDVLSPFERAYAWHVPCPLIVEAMQEAARLVEGRHDFAAFQAAGGSARTTERIVLSSIVHGTRVPRHAEDDLASPGHDGLEGGRRGRILSYEVTGSGFLRHMVRTIAGSLIEIGSGRRSAGWLGEVLAARDRARAGPTAPAEGLFLVRVDYNKPDVP